MQSPVVTLEPKIGEPGLLFHEFVFLLSRIAITNVNTSGDISGKLNDFFVEKLGFTRVIDIKRAKITFDDVSRRIAQGDEDREYGASDEDEDGEWDSDEIDMDENQKKLMEFLAKKAEE